MFRKLWKVSRRFLHLLAVRVPLEQMSEPRLKLAERTIAFSKDVLRFCRGVQVTPSSRPMIGQLTKSATSIGANYAEACNAPSKIDFRHKVYIAKKEAAETEYWLELFADMPEYTEQALALKQECHYILMTLQKTINTVQKSTPPTN